MASDRSGFLSQDIAGCNPITRFDDRAKDYANFRPSYPAAAIDAILEGIKQNPIVADVGAGTGISSRLLAERDAVVFAIEPNAAMSGVAVTHPNVTFINAAAEKTTLAENSVDVVTAFQSFHWFEPNAALAEFHRILREGGRAALVWNERDWGDAFTAAYGMQLRTALGEDHPAFSRQNAGKSSALIASSPLFRNARELIFANSKRMTLEGLIGAALSASYVPKSGEAHEKLMLGLKRIHAQFSDAAGCVEMVYKTEVMLAERAQ